MSDASCRSRCHVTDFEIGTSQLSRLRSFSEHALLGQRKFRTPLHHTFQSCSLFLRGWGLIDLPLRASNEGLLRPRVARAQEINRLHSLLCSVSTGPMGCPSHPFHRARSASNKDGPVPSHFLNPNVIATHRPGNDCVLSNLNSGI